MAVSIPYGNSAAAGDEFTVAWGKSAAVALDYTTGNTPDANSSVRGNGFIERKMSSGGWMRIATLTSAAPAVFLDGQATYRVRREAGATLGISVDVQS